MLRRPNESGTNSDFTWKSRCFNWKYFVIGGYCGLERGLCICSGTWEPSRANDQFWNHRGNRKYRPNKIFSKENASDHFLHSFYTRLHCIQNVSIASLSTRIYDYFIQYAHFSNPENEWETEFLAKLIEQKDWKFFLNSNGQSNIGSSPYFMFWYFSGFYRLFFGAQAIIVIKWIQIRKAIQMNHMKKKKTKLHDRTSTLSTSYSFINFIYRS